MCCAFMDFLHVLYICVFVCVFLLDTKYGVFKRPIDQCCSVVSGIGGGVGLVGQGLGMGLMGECTHTYKYTLSHACLDAWWTLVCFHCKCWSMSSLASRVSDGL